MRVLATFNAILRIGQIESGARRAGFRQVDLAAVARDIVEAFQPAAEEEGKTLTAELDEALPLSGDRELLTQMVANVVDNALRHTPSGTHIVVASARRGGRRKADGERRRAWRARGRTPAHFRALLPP